MIDNSNDVSKKLLRQNEGIKKTDMEETRMLTEKISDLMAGFRDRVIAVSNFSLLDKTWEFSDDSQLNYCS